MSFAYIGKDFYLVASPKGGSLSKSGGEKSQVVQPELEVSCKTSFIPHAQSPAAAAEQCIVSPAGKLLLPVPYKCLVKQPPVAAWNSHLHFESPTERYPSHLSSTEMDQAQATPMLPEVLHSEQIFDLFTHIILSVSDPGA